MTEPYLRPRLNPGWVEVISGCMFSGKTEELIRQLRRAELARQPFQVFKPRIDNRYSADHVASHNKTMFPSICVDSASEILAHLERSTLIVGIDEGQFFGDDLIQVVSQLADLGKRVLIAGLDTDWRGRPFGPMPQLLAMADVIRKQYAICMVCGEPATRTQRLAAQQDDILVGSTDAYEARCRAHFDPELSARLQKILHSKTTADLESSCLS